jgi:DNA invertase Pin-like site-specific DNA recombinase
MKPGSARRCAIYTRKSSEQGLEQDFNSLDAQREAAIAYITSQKHDGWKLIETHYDDGGWSGGNVDRPALKALLADIELGKIDIVVVYKVDRLTRSLADFAKLIEIFDRKGVSFVSVTQQFNTTSSMGRLDKDTTSILQVYLRDYRAEVAKQRGETDPTLLFPDNGRKTRHALLEAWSRRAREAGVLPRDAGHDMSGRA